MKVCCGDVLCCAVVKTEAGWLAKAVADVAGSVDRRLAARNARRHRAQVLRGRGVPLLWLCAGVARGVAVDGGHIYYVVILKAGEFCCVQRGSGGKHVGKVHVHLHALELLWHPLHVLREADVSAMFQMCLSCLQMLPGFIGSGV